MSIMADGREQSRRGMLRLAQSRAALPIDVPVWPTPLRPRRLGITG